MDIKYILPPPQARNWATLAPQLECCAVHYFVFFYICESFLESVLHWRRDAKKSVWMKVPISQSYLIPVAFAHGFSYHHAVGDYAMLLKWLPQRVACKVPPYATHQVGVAGEWHQQQIITMRDKPASMLSKVLWWRAEKPYPQESFFAGQ